ncbi:tape measure protein [Acinetobacter baumannii]|uniref:tape measure protein n=1 Tax=Acinetobacter baumannii TaxID=470 RepID=UPI0029B404F3|nr:tape measure protein [Acinetobacter baumannii]MDZ3982100.1 tape measure protein [Acinetobacter baumannii]MDZ3982918.1 tape measure protein [Acinetobacter baumannii]MDZ3987176.1 tape measure protein [Acinetobacter baumannii]MDZ3996259.1 tape measure protein [Acinetobacter baumannii]MDZ4003697.1 tape measure protein [Acinetobacter baumannii]
MAQESRLVIVIDAKNAERNARNLGNELDSIERKGDFATKSMDALSVATRQLAGYMAGLVTVSAAINNMDTYTGLQNRLKLVTNNQVELNKATEDTFRIAQKTYSAWDSVLQVYQRFSDNAKTLNLTMDDTARLTETVSKAVAISGASAQAADAALVQFGQALASGTLRGEELNSVMEQTPALAKAIAQGMGITVGELRSVAAEGKITSQEIVKALRNVEKDVDALFAKTDITIGQSLTLLNNEITKFVGESGKGSGAAQVLAGNIQTLAGNLDVLTSAMMVGGAYWLGTYIPAIYASGVAVAAKIKELAAQTVTQYAAIQAERAAAAQQVISTQTVVANTQATLAAIAAEKALEVQRLKSQITEKGRTATLTRMAELKKIEAQVTRELALAEEALAVAQSRSAAAGAASVGIGSRLLGLLGGPVGIGITVASLAAGYLLMRDNTAEANKKLEEQARVAEKTDEALKKLAGNDKTKAVDDLTAAFNAQNEALSKSSLAVGAALIDIENYARGNREVENISQEARKGTISYAEAIERLNKIKLPTDLYEKLKKQAAQYDENSSKANLSAEKLKLFGVEVNLAGNKAQNAAVQVKGNTDELNSNANAADKAAKAQKGYFDSLRTEVINSNEELALLNLGYSEETVKKILELQKAKQAVAAPGTTAIITKEEMDQIAKAQKALDALKEKKDALTAAERKHTSELEKQQKVLSVNAKVQANAAKYGFAGIESKYNLPAGTLSALHMIESRGNAKAYNKSTGATGGFQFLEGTAKQYGVKDRTDLAQSAEGAGKYMAYLLKLFKGDLEKAVRAYHAGEGNVQKGKGIGKYNNQYWKDFQGYMAGINGYTAGDITSKDFDKLIQDATKMAEEQAKLRLQLENDVANEVTKIRNDLAKKLEDVDKANFTPERKAEIKAELQARADNDVAIAQQALKTKLDDYKQFNMTEEQLLKDSFDRKKFNAAHDIELSKDQRDEAIKYLDQQYQHELELINLTKAARQSAYDQANLKALQELKQERDILAAPIWQRAGLSLQFGERNALSENDATLINKGDEAKMKLKQKEIDQLEYNKRIEDAVRIHEENKFKIQEEYAQKYQDLQQSQHQTQLELYGSLLSQASTVWSSMTEMVKSSAGEQNSTYKAMFLMQQAIAIGQAIISTELAATKALELGPIAGVPAAALVRGMGYASVGLIAAQTIAGFSDGGYTGNGLKHTPAGIVHKGEVVWSQDDIKRWGGVSVVESMRQSKPSGYANGGYVSNNTSEAIAARREARQFDAINSGRIEKSQPTVTIINQTSEKVDATSEWDGKELTVILKEYQKQNEAMVDAKIEKRFRMSKRQGW